MKENFDGWQDGKFNPDSQEPDYDFLFGNKEPEQEPSPQPMKQNKINPQQIRTVRKILINSIWQNIYKTNTQLLLDEDGIFIIKNGQGEVKIIPQNIEGRP